MREDRYFVLLKGKHKGQDCLIKGYVETVKYQNALCFGKKVKINTKDLEPITDPEALEEKSGVCCLDCGRNAIGLEYSCGQCIDCGGSIGDESEARC